MQIDISEPQTEEEFAEYYRIRYEQLRKPLGAPPGSERSEPIEAESKHMIAKVDGRVVGAETWVVLTKGSATNRELYVQSRQTAVDPAVQYGGIGSALINAVEDRARALNATELIGFARVDVVGWLEGLGWKVRGRGPKLLGQVEHVLMVKDLR